MSWRFQEPKTNWFSQARKANQSEKYGQDSASRGALGDTRKWRLETGNRKLETRNWKMEIGKSKLGIWGSQFPVSNF
jgi:hypothetical protein